MSVPVGIEFPDLELWLCGYLRTNLAAWAPLVDRRFPATTWTPGFAVVVRDDGGPSRMVTAERRIGVTVIGADHAATRALAERVAALIRVSPAPGSVSPVAAVDAVNGPYSVEAAPGRAEFYMTAGLIVAGEPITL